MKLNDNFLNGSAGRETDMPETVTACTPRSSNSVLTAM